MQNLGQTVGNSSEKVACDVAVSSKNCTANTEDFLVLSIVEKANAFNFCVTKLCMSDVVLERLSKVM